MTSADLNITYMNITSSSCGTVDVDCKVVGVVLQTGMLAPCLTYKPYYLAHLIKVVGGCCGNRPVVKKINKPGSCEYVIF